MAFAVHTAPLLRIASTARATLVNLARSLEAHMHHESSSKPERGEAQPSALGGGFRRPTAPRWTGFVRTWCQLLGRHGTMGCAW
jgi:hypothetical protein